MNGGFIFVSKVSHSGPSTDNKQNLKTKTYIDIVFFPEYLVSILFSYFLYKLSNDDKQPFPLPAVRFPSKSQYVIWWCITPMWLKQIQDL